MIHVPGFTDESALLKHELAYCLGQMKLPSALPVLESVLENIDEDPMVRHEVSVYIVNLSPSPFPLYTIAWNVLTSIRDRQQKQWARSHRLIQRRSSRSTSRIPIGAFVRLARLPLPKLSGITLQRVSHQENPQIRPRMCLAFTFVL